MTVAVAPKNTTMSKGEFLIRLNKLADQLMQLGFADEADRAREIAKDIRALPTAVHLHTALQGTEHLQKEQRKPKTQWSSDGKSSPPRVTG